MKLLEKEENFWLKMVSTKDIKSLLRKVSTKKAAGIDSILPKLVKLAAERLCQPLTEAKNTCINQNNFPNNSKVAFPVPLDKGKSNKHDMSNLF